MKKVYFLINIFAIFLYSCSKEDKLDLPNVPESIKQHITTNCTCDPRIGLFKWGERMLYVHWYIGPSCNSINLYYDEQGRKIELTAEERNDFWEEKELVRMIWVCGE